MIELDAGLKVKLDEIETDDLFQDDTAGVVHVLKKYIDAAIDHAAQIVAEHYAGEIGRYRACAEIDADYMVRHAGCVGELRTQLAAANRVVAAAKEWRPIAEAIATPDLTINVRTITSYRWLPYSGKSEQFKRGVKGRWQRATEYGWENAALPENSEFDSLSSTTWEG